MFILSGVTLAVLAVIILGVGTLFNKKFMMETYFDDSVQGLSVGAPLKDPGVTIGSVEHIGFVKMTTKQSSATTTGIAMVTMLWSGCLSKRCFRGSRMRKGGLEWNGELRKVSEFA